jgi:ABC-2 type transport system ATP-binding protein
MSSVILEGQSLRKKFGDVIALDDLSIEVLRGEVFGLLGPNGAGKTTAINILVGLIRPDSGRVYLDGKRISDGKKKVLDNVGVCPQQITLWERLTCIEQLIFIGNMYGMTRMEARDRGEGLLQTLGLKNKKKKLAKTLSGGMQRRLNLAMALVHDPEILILDEPEAGLDPQSRVLVREYVKSLAGEKTIILTSHNMDEVDRMADRVAIIDQGKVLVLDSPDRLKASVGTGDVVEIKIDHKLQDLSSLVNLLKGLETTLQYEILGDVIFVRGFRIIHYLPDLISLLKSNQIVPESIQLRENTLEDVFIQFTGRRLRE